MNKQDAFENFNKSVQDFRNESVENKGRVNINYNGPVINVTPPNQQTNNHNKTIFNKIADSVNTASTIVNIGTKALKTGTALLAITSPAWAPKVMTKIADGTNKKLIRLADPDNIEGYSSEKKDYFEKLQTANNEFVINYDNNESSPLTNYLISINEPLVIGAVFKFKTENSLTKFFSSYLKRKENIIHYKEIYSESKNGVSKQDTVLYHIYKNEEHEFCFKISSLTAIILEDLKEDDKNKYTIEPDGKTINVELNKNS